MSRKGQTEDPSVGRFKLNGLSCYGAALSLAKAGLLSLRPLQWTKSLLLLLPLAFSVNERWLTDDTGFPGEILLKAVAGAVIFCTLSGAIYIINDVLDRQPDQEHPRKRYRPIASGELPLAAAGSIALILLALSFAGGFLLRWEFGALCVGFVFMNLAYSSLLKRIIILDVMMVSAGYLLRVVAGALIIDVTVSPWLYTTIGLGALFIALGKRYSELSTAGTKAPIQRSVLGQYSREFLSQLLSITSTSTLVAYALYTFTANNVPENHSMMLTAPFVVFGVFRYLYLVNHTDAAESPEMVMIQDRPLVADILLWATVAIAILAMNR